ncbi:AAA family ATPase, partial [Salmonella enterica subsp. enterica serovar Kentucky]|uniref:AAA family ATPase n=1 Tax=Salmonella enterica TaxID=28901 RepID=UPI003F4CADE3
YSVDVTTSVIVVKGDKLHAHIYPHGETAFTVAAVGASDKLPAFDILVRSNPKEAEPQPDGVYGVIFNHLFIDKFNDIDSLQYNFNNHSAHLAGLMPEMYPKVDANKLMELYTETDESVLILTGVPGVGKTCFTKMVCKAMADIRKRTTRITYVKDPELLKRDDFWITMQASEPDMLILDDLDDELKPRVDGKNPIMNHMLSFSDGIFPKRTKIVITTNQPNSAIDKAIIRPGRCFDILSLPRLSDTEALTVWTETFGRDEETFTSTFGDVTGKTISQAALMSEHKRLGLSERPDYLLDASISIRRSVEDGAVANAEG